MAKYSAVISADYNTLITGLDNSILDSGVSVVLVDEFTQSTNDSYIYTKVYEKYFIRNSSRSSLTLTLIATNDDIHIYAIGSGGSDNALLNFNWGAEQSMVNVVKKYIESINSSSDTFIP